MSKEPTRSEKDGNRTRKWTLIYLGGVNNSTTNLGRVDIEQPYIVGRGPAREVGAPGDGGGAQALLVHPLHRVLPGHGGLAHCKAQQTILIITLFASLHEINYFDLGLQPGAQLGNF